jgi:hypothetical protein
MYRYAEKEKGREYIANKISNRTRHNNKKRKKNEGWGVPSYLHRFLTTQALSLSYPIALAPKPAGSVCIQQSCNQITRFLTKIAW